mgnify:CR=1 FL=1
MNHKKTDNQSDARYKKYKGILKNLTMMNDVFLCEMYLKNRNVQNMFFK